MSKLPKWYLKFGQPKSLIRVGFSLSYFLLLCGWKQVCVCVYKLATLYSLWGSRYYNKVYIVAFCCKGHTQMANWHWANVRICRRRNMTSSQRHETCWQMNGKMTLVQTEMHLVNALEWIRFPFRGTLTRFLFKNCKLNEGLKIRSKRLILVRNIEVGFLCLLVIFLTSTEFLFDLWPSFNF